MKKFLRKMKKALSIMLVLSMIFTSHAFVTFAENVEETTEETTSIENVEETTETTVEEDDNVGASEENVGASTTSPEEKSDEGEIEEPEDDTDESLETDYPEEPEEDETDYIEEPEEDPTIAESTESTEDESSGESFDEQETIENEQNSSGGSETEETNIEEESEETLTIEEIEVNTEDKLFGATTKYLDYIVISQYTTKTYYVGDTYDPSNLKIKAYYMDADTGEEEWEEVAYTDDTKSKFSFSPDCVSSPFTASTTEEDPYNLTITYTDDAGDSASTSTGFQVHPATTPTPTAYVYYMKYNDTTKKYEDKYATIESGKTDEELNTFINGLWDTTFENRLVSWFVMSPTDPSKEVLAAYDHFNTKFDYDGTKEQFKVAYNNWNNGTPTENLHLGAGFSKCLFSLFYRVKYGSYDPEKTYGFGPEGQTDEQFEEFFKPIIDETMIKDGVKGLYTFDITDPMNPLNDYNEYYTGASVYEATLTGLKQAYDDWNDNPTANLSVGVIYTDPSASTTYTVTYNQNLPSGYAVPTSKTWYTDSTTTDLAGSPIILNGSAEMTCEDTSGYVRTLQGWNTYSSGAGSSYSFGASINTDAGFAGYTLTLYAMWSDPVAPTTGFMYWKVDGDDNNKTIHYYASPGTGRAAVVIGTDGVEHTSLGSSDREKIKYAVFEDNIAATNLESCFENFKGLESITNLRKLDTSNVTSMRQMFMSAGVKELDLTNFDTSNVTDMYGMFSSCENLETIRVSDKFVVDKVSTSNGKFMFANCDKLEGEKGTKISDLSSPFGAAYAHIDEGSTNPGLFSSASTPPGPAADWYWYLEGDTIIHYTNTYETGRTPVEYDANGAVVYNGLSDSLRYNNIETAVFDNKIVAPKVQSFFKEFLRLKTITDITNLDTSTATSFKEMFASCGSLETLDVSSLKTSNATDMESMFQWCNALTSLDVSNLDTSKVTNMVSMFNSCKKIAELDLSSFKTSNVKSMAAMFTNCEELTTIKTTVDFVVDQVTDLTYNNLFEGNTKLVGGQGTTYNASKLKKEYAHIDEGPTNPGYFTGTIPPTPPTPPTPAKTVANISVKSFNATTVATSDDFSSFSVPFISDSERFDPNGMVITVTYDDSSTAEVTYDNTTASQFTITYNAPRVDIEYGGKSVIYDFSIVSEPNFYIYFFDSSNKKRARGIYDDSFVSKIEDLYNYVSSGRELGFYVINATGLQDAYNKYNANATATMTLTEAMAEAQNITSVLPMTQYTFWGVTNRSKSQGGGTIIPGGINFSGGGDDGGSSSGASDPTKGPMGDLTKSLDAIRTWLNEQINTSNDIPQSSLLKDDSLASYLKSSPENINRPYTNAQDENGNRGYGQWLRVPNTTTWYFFSGDLSQANGQSSGFLANGWYNLGWDGQEKWYYFDENGVMKIGWHEIGGKMYYLDSNLSFNWYGSRTTGTKVIDGISYNFNDKGELDTTGGNNNIDTNQFDSQFVDNMANFGNVAGALPLNNTTGSLSNQDGIHLYGGELSAPNMISRSNFEPGPGV